MAQVRNLITALRGAVATLEGKQRLQEAMQFNRWRAARGEDAANLAQMILVDQANNRIVIWAISADQCSGGIRMHQDSILGAFRDVPAG